MMPTFKAVKSQIRMPDAIVRQIEEKILLGKLKPSSMLPSENQMVKEFGVSRNTVREALRMLEASGMIKIKQGSRGGAMVTQLTDEFVSDFLVKAIRIGSVSGDHVCQVRLGLEPYIAEMLAKKENINPELLSLMEKNVAEAKKIHEAGGITGYLDMDFHVLLAMATENPMFITILKTLKISFDIITTHLKERVESSTLKYHRRILKAIKERDSVTARELMYRHLLQIRDVMKTERIVT